MKIGVFEYMLDDDDLVAESSSFKKIIANFVETLIQPLYAVLSRIIGRAIR